MSIPVTIDELIVTLYEETLFWRDQVHQNIPLNHRITEDSWTFGELFIHVWLSNKYFYKSAYRCQEEGVEGMDKSKAGQVIFIDGAFPPVKVKVPSKFPDPIAPDSLDILFEKYDKQLKEIAPLKAMVVATDPHLKVLHPVFGHLNAQEWLENALMHMRHHRKQLKTFTE